MRTLSGAALGVALLLPVLARAQGSMNQTQSNGPSTRPTAPVTSGAIGNGPEESSNAEGKSQPTKSNPGTEPASGSATNPGEAPTQTPATPPSSAEDGGTQSRPGAQSPSDNDARNASPSSNAPEEGAGAGRGGTPNEAPIGATPPMVPPGTSGAKPMNP
jgi:hypothetical protein